METAEQQLAPPSNVAAPTRQAQVKALRKLPVGWAALLVSSIGVVVSIALTLAGVVDYGVAGFLAALIIVGTMLGLAAWDFAVGLLALRHTPELALPHEVTLHIDPRVVPYLSPAAFAVGLLIGHQYWH